MYYIEQPLLPFLSSFSHRHSDLGRLHRHRRRHRRLVAPLAVLAVVVELVALAEGAAAAGAEEVPAEAAAAVVLPADVAVEVALLEEGVPAHRARVRPLRQVVHAVVPQLGQGEEALQSTTKVSATLSLSQSRGTAAQCLCRPRCVRSVFLSVRTDATPETRTQYPCAEDRHDHQEQTGTKMGVSLGFKGRGSRAGVDGAEMDSFCLRGKKLCQFPFRRCILSRKCRSCLVALCGPLEITNMEPHIRSPRRRRQAEANSMRPIRHN